MSRQQVVERIERLVGPPLSITDPADGWPALGSVRTVERTLPVALFVGLVGRPESREIALHDDLRETRVSPAHACFISTTFPALAEPRVSGAQPRAEAFVRRYRLFSDEYSWAPH